MILVFKQCTFAIRLHIIMSSVPVEIVVYNETPAKEIRIELTPTSTLGELGAVIETLTGKYDFAWVCFSDERTNFIPFGKPDQGTDGLQIQFLRCSNREGSAVSVGVIRYAIQPEPDAELPVGN